MSIAIRVEHVSKEYRLGIINHGTFYKDFQSWVARKLKKPDPNAKIGEQRFEGQESHFWALKDVSFDIEEGDKVGIIGKNGAGKSTLLKILSRITAPTNGTLKIKGRLASLLEVGTGFHPELTGRENVYLNGAILGMKKDQIDSKFDEIVDFAEIENFIDTPVKRYSSGMYVRLAFSVASNLNSDTLILDEVLSVGDAKFQEKCVRKIDRISKDEGRTILFVTHNMSVVNSLCNSCILLEKGTITGKGNTNSIISKYLGDEDSNINVMEATDDALPDPAKKLKIRRARILSEGGKIPQAVSNNMNSVLLEIQFEILFPMSGCDISYELWENGSCLYCSCMKDQDVKYYLGKKWEKGFYSYQTQLPIDMLRDGQYLINVAAAIPRVEVLDRMHKSLKFTLTDEFSPVFKSGESRPGVLLPVIKWNIAR